MFEMSSVHGYVHPASFQNSSADATAEIIVIVDCTDRLPYEMFQIVVVVVVVVVVVGFSWVYHVFDYTPQRKITRR